MSKYGIGLLLICLIDLLTTVYGIKCGILTEANPLLLFFLIRYGLPGLISAKIFFTIPLVLALEKLPEYCPQAKKRKNKYFLFVIFAYSSIFIFSCVYQGCCLLQLKEF